MHYHALFSPPPFIEVIIVEKIENSGEQKYVYKEIH